MPYGAGQIASTAGEAALAASPAEALIAARAGPGSDGTRVFQRRRGDVSAPGFEFGVALGELRGGLVG
jgi:hypothetical protein